MAVKKVAKKAEPKKMTNPEKQAMAVSFIEKAIENVNKASDVFPQDVGKNRCADQVLNLETLKAWLGDFYA